MAQSIANLLNRLDRWPRRLSALTCLVLAAASAVAAHGQSAGGQSHPAQVRVIVAARDLGAGATLTVHDLTTANWPRELVPAGALAKPARLAGRRLAGPLRRREAITATRLVGAGLTAGLAPGEVAAAVLTDVAAATLVHPGDRVDILARPVDEGALGTRSPSSDTTTAGAILVAESVVVLAVLPPPDPGGGSGDAQVIVATDRGTALRIVALQGHHVIAVLADSP